MSSETMQASPSAAQAPLNHTLRLWPGLFLAALLWLLQLWSVTGEFYIAKFMIGKMFGPMVITGGLIAWWLFGSRLKWSDRWLGVLSLLAIAGITFLTVESSVRGMPLIIYGLPVLATAWVGWLLVSIPFSWPVRRTGLIAVFLAIGAFGSTLRLNGMNGSFAADFQWRWTPTGEARLLAELKPAKVAEPLPNTELVLQASDWPGFRGAKRDSQVHGVQIQTDWQKWPPRELWRHRIGPGWSSFAVVGKHVFTQEQRGDDELVVCYDAETGAEVWSHADANRFMETVSGPGPRGTPTFHKGRIYALGGKGTLNCLNAATGKLIWSKNIIDDTKAEIPMWGFSSSPLVAYGRVSVFAGGKDGNSVAAYDIQTGECAWKGGTGSLSYCSTQLANLSGVDQVLITTETGLTSFDPTTGEILWLHEWPAEKVARVVQPAVLNSTDVLIGTGMGVGTRRISVQQASQTWSSKEDWTTRDIKPYFNDFVVSDDAMYGFDGNIFMCVGLKDGTRTWRARGYGNGQVLLLADQKLLLILSEEGDVALVEANPKKHIEVARFKAITGKTWNHPVVANGKLFVRNSEEVAAFELTLLPYTEPANENDSSKASSSTPESLVNEQPEKTD